MSKKPTTTRRITVTERPARVKGATHGRFRLQPSCEKKLVTTFNRRPRPNVVYTTRCQSSRAICMKFPCVADRYLLLLSKASKINLRSCDDAGYPDADSEHGRQLLAAAKD